MKKNNNSTLKIILLIIGLIYLATFAIALLPILIIPVLAVLIYARVYFKSEKFQSLKSSIADYITDCNELNAHINDLRSSYVDIHKTDYGEASYTNISKNSFKKMGITNAKYAPTIYDCSLQVCDSARKQPFKYICKYFNIKPNEESLEQFEEILNDFTAAEEGKEISKRKHDEIINLNYSRQ